MAKEKNAKTEVVKPAEGLYSVEEMVAASKHVFGLNSECAAAALRNVEGKIGIEEAKRLVDEFMNKEVK